MAGIYWVLEGQVFFGAYFIFAAAICDFLDGFAARLLNAHSAIGAQLDSLADMVTFGALPAFIVSRQTDRFIGVPTPANALLISTLPFLAEKFAWAQNLVYNPFFLLVFSLGFALMLTAEIPLIALKFKRFDLKDNIYRYLTLLIGLTCLLTMGIAGIPFAIISYVGLSIIEARGNKDAKNQQSV